MRSPDSATACQLVTLASGPLVRVDRCMDCGTITLHLGAVSLRLDRSAAESLWTTLGHGLSARVEPSCEEHAEHGRIAH